jgi:geranylgeranyl diphosphate synthase type II
MINFATFRQQYTSRIDEALSQQINQYQKDVDFAEMMRYALLNGGKRLRPLLTLATIQSFGKAPSEEAILAATAVEWIHSYSLVHDDLPALDNDALRRGQPTVHKKFGEAQAILVGDALLTGAFEIFGRLKTLPATTLVDLYRTLSNAAGANGMVIGQVADILGQHKQYSAEALLNKVHADKTGALLRYSAMAGGILAPDLTDEQRQNVVAALSEFGYYFGLAFQVQDDLDDIAQGSDAPLGTLPKLLGETGAREQRDAFLAQAQAQLHRIQTEVPDFDQTLLQEFLELIHD